MNAGQRLGGLLPAAIAVGVVVAMFADPVVAQGQRAAGQTVLLDETGTVEVGTVDALGGAIAYTHLEPVTRQGSLIVLDGSGIPSLVETAPDYFYGDVGWAAPGQLIYAGGSDGGPLDLFRRDLDEGRVKRLADGEDGSVSDVVVAPDGSRIAFARELADGSTATFLVQSDGSGERSLDAANALSVEPDFGCGYLDPARRVPLSWSPDGEQLLIALSVIGCEAEFSDVAIVAVDTDQVVDAGAADAESAEWSPDGDEVVYDTDEGILVAPDSEQVESAEEVQDEAYAGEAPTWSPEGDLAFVGSNDWEDVAAYGIFVVTDDAGIGAEPQPLDTPEVRVADPEWSPDATHVAFRGLTDDGAELWVAAVDGEPSQRVPGTGSGYVVDFAYASREEN